MSLSRGVVALGPDCVRRVPCLGDAGVGSWAHGAPVKFAFLTATVLLAGTVCENAHGTPSFEEVVSVCERFAVAERGSKEFCVDPALKGWVPVRDVCHGATATRAITALDVDAARKAANYAASFRATTKGKQLSCAGVQGWGDQDEPPTGGTSASRGILPGTFDLAPVLVGVEHFLEKRARLELQDYFVRVAGAHLCGSSVVRTLLPVSAQLVCTTTASEPKLISAQQLAASLSEDARNLPVSVATHGGGSPETQFTLLAAHALAASADPRVVITQLTASSALPQYQASMQLLRYLLSSSAPLRPRVVQAILRSTTSAVPDFDTLRALDASAAGIRAALDALSDPAVPDKVRTNQSYALGQQTIVAMSLTVQAVGAPKPDWTDLAALHDALARSDYPAALAKTLWLARGHLSLDAQATQVLATAAALLQAGTAEDAERAMEALASSATSYKSKRNAKGFYVNGFVGLGSGFEVRPRSGVMQGPILPLQASLGLDVILAPEQCALGLYFPLVDLGALLPIDGEEASAKRRTEAYNLLSPGVYLRFALGDSPLVVLAGASAGLSASPGADAEFAIRVGGSLSVDVTLIRL